MPLDGELKEITDRLGKAFEEFKATNDRQIGELKKGIADVVTADKLARLNDQLDKLVEAKAALEKAAAAEAKRMDDLERRLNRPPGPGAGDPAKAAAALADFNAVIRSEKSLARVSPQGLDEEAYGDYRKGFVAHLRGGAALLDAERKTMSVGGDPDGGYFVPAETSGRIVTRVFDTSPIRQIASAQAITSDALEGPIDKDEAGFGWVGETGARPATTTAQIGKWRIPVHEMYAMPEATQQLLDDAAVDVEAWLAGKVADKMARGENTAFVVGTGVGQPQGFAAYPLATTADATRPWGTLQYVFTGVNGNFAASNPGDILFNLIAEFKQPYLNNANWVTRREVIALIRKFKEATTNAYMWQPGLQQGQPDRLLGYPIIMAEDLPAVSANSISLAFGDFRQGYQIVDRQGIRVLRDPYTNKPFVRFYTTRRVGGGVVQFECIKFVKFATS